MKISFPTQDSALPEGQYAATLTGVSAVQQGKQSHKPYIALTFTITKDGYEGTRRIRNYSLQPQSVWALRQTFVNLGGTPPAPEEEVDVNAMLEEVIGNRCVLTLEQREWQGAMRDNIKAVDAAEGFQF